MKREILFKGKLSHVNIWVEGNLIIANNGCQYIIPSNVFEPDGHHLIIDSDEPWWVDENTVCQFTGLTDKNGTNIFEGDIVEVCGCGIASVIFNTSMASFMVLTKSKYNDGTNIHVGFEETEQDEIEVIGNIFDSPELLK